MGRPAFCSVDGCKRLRSSPNATYCPMHYHRVRRTGDAGEAEARINRKKKAKEQCSIEGCDKGGKITRGWCIMHYKRWLRNGCPNKTLRTLTESTEESFALRTKWQGECRIWTGSKSSNGYGWIWADGEDVLVHRYVWERDKGTIPHGMFIDHICHNPSCVNIKHLRLATVQQNSANRSGADPNSASGIRNVYKNTSGKWRVRIQTNGVNLGFGTYGTLEEAAAVAEQARKEVFGEFAGKG